nr:NADH-quinone oxidoreductase subunit NuoK [Flexivirga oryzae]
MVVVGLLFGIGLYGVLARRNAILVLIGVELMLAAAGLLFVTVGSLTSDTMRAGQIMTIFVITIAAAEIAVALGVILAIFRSRGNIDMAQAGERE